MLEAGSASVDITPKKPVYLGGYGVGPLRLCNKLSAPIYARALVLKERTLPKDDSAEGGDVKVDAENVRAVAFLVLDTQGLPFETRRNWFGFRAVQERVRKAVSADLILFGASSHSHCAPDSTGLWGGLDDEYAKLLVDGAVSAVTEAYRRVEPCELSFGCKKTDGLSRSQVRAAPHDQVEDRAFVLQARSTSGKPIGRIIVFSAHPTVAAGNHLTPDWPGEISSAFEQDPGGTTLVIPGCIGRTQPKTSADGSQKSVREYARLLKSQIRPLLLNLEPLTKPQFTGETTSSRPPTSLEDRSMDAVAPYGRFLDAREAIVEHTATNLAMLAIATALKRAGGHSEKGGGLRVRSIAKVVRVGDVYFFGFPGEAYPNLQWALEDEMSAIADGARVVACSMVGDQVGYLIYPTHTYTALAARAAWNDNALFCASPSLAKHILETLVDLASDITGSKRKRPEKRRITEEKIWDAIALPASGVATALTIAGAGAYGAMALGKPVLEAASKFVRDAPHRNR